MRRSRIALVGVLGLVAVGIGVGISNNEGPSLSGTATTLCEETSTHHCSPASIVEGPGEAHWNNTSAVKFTNENSHDNGNNIAWWASNGAHTSSVFYFRVDAQDSKTLGFTCPVDHLFADNKGNANTVFTSVVPAPALEDNVKQLPEYEDLGYRDRWHVPEVDFKDSKYYNQPNDDMRYLTSENEMTLYKGVRVIRVKNKSENNVVAHIKWQVWTAYMKSVISKVNIDPHEEAKIVLPCATNILLWNEAQKIWSEDSPDDVCEEPRFEIPCWVKPSLLITKDL